MGPNEFKPTETNRAHVSEIRLSQQTVWHNRKLCVLISIQTLSTWNTNEEYEIILA